MRKFPALVLTRAMVKSHGYVFSDYFHKTHPFMTAPLRVVELPELTVANAMALESTLRCMDRLDPKPCVVQSDGWEDASCDFVVFDGQYLSFYQLLSAGIFAAREARLNLATWQLEIAANGQRDDRRMDNAQRRGFFAWALSEAMMYSPDENLTHYDATSTISSGRRVAIPSFDFFKVPEDPILLAGYGSRAISNKEEIKRMNHVFERTTLSADNGLAKSGYRIECCKCDTVEDIVASGHTGSLPQTVINKKFQQKGWKTGRKPVCPGCQAKSHHRAEAQTMKAKTIDSIATQINSQSPPQPPVAIDPPRQMTAADKRKVFRAIDDQWDENKGRYIGAASDQHLADTLGVPRAWVKEVREENFGKTQRNEDLDKAIGDAKNLRAEAARNAATALDLATKFEQLDQKYQDLIRRLEAVE